MPPLQTPLLSTHPKPLPPGPDISVESTVHHGFLNIRKPTSSSPGKIAFDTLLPDAADFFLHSLQTAQAFLYPNQPARGYRYPFLCLAINDYDGLAVTIDCSIHLSLNWLAELGKQDPQHARHELQGVIMHEIVHTIQYDGLKTTPHWFIEGLADLVRLSTGFGARHWKGPGGGGSWEDAYETTGYFFAWLGQQKGVIGTVVGDINERLEKRKWDEKWWGEITGMEVGDLWACYKAEVGRVEDKVEEGKVDGVQDGTAAKDNE